MSSRRIRERIANLERSLRHDPVLEIRLAPWLLKRLKAAGLSPADLVYKPFRKPPEPAGHDPEDGEDVVG